MIKEPKYELTHAAWEVVLAVEADFQEFFALTAAQKQTGDTEYDAIQDQIFRKLGIPPGTEDSISALLKICAAAQYARGLLEAHEQADGTRLLYEVAKH